MTRPDWMPTLFIAGAPKAGTSSLHTWLADHPDALGAIEKETYFFVDPGTHMFRADFNIHNGLETYQTQFPQAEAHRPLAVIDSTPSYIYNRAALEHIPDLPGAPRCLFMLREPAAQIYSLYTYFRGNWDWIPPEMSFGDYLTAVRAGSHDFKGNELARHALNHARYAEHLLRWRDRLGAERMMVVTFDALRRDEVALTKRVALWAGLDPTFYDDYGFGRENETYAPRNRGLQRLNLAMRGALPKGAAYAAIRGAYRWLNTRKPDGPGPAETALLAALREEFAPHNARLAAAFDLDLAAWS